MAMKEIKTHEDLKEALNQTRSVVMYAKPDCLHCTIVRNCVESIERHFPLIGFYFTEDINMPVSQRLNAFPVLVMYENGVEQGRLVGSKYITKIRDLLNLWFLKD